MTSPIWPSPPPLTMVDNEERVCSVVGYVEDWFNDRVAPGCRRPLGCSPSGGFSARCIDPSRLVCPTEATAFAGTTTSGLTEISTLACQASTVILPTLPTMTSLIMTGEFDSSVATFGTWTV